MSNQNWATPDYVLRAIETERMDINFDAACTSNDCVTTKGFYYDLGVNALEASWLRDGTFCNPPWKQTNKFVEHAYNQWVKHGTEILMLIPASVNTGHFHKYICNIAHVFFPTKRIAYVDTNNPTKTSPMHESMIVHFNKDKYSGFSSINLEQYKIKGE